MEEVPVNPWVVQIPWRRKWQPAPVFLPGEFHGQRILVGYSPWGCKRVVHNWSDLAWSMYTNIHTYAYIHTNTCTHIHTSTQRDIHIHMHTYTHKHTYIYIHTHTRTQSLIYTHTYRAIISIVSITACTCSPFFILEIQFSCGLLNIRMGKLVPFPR